MNITIRDEEIFFNLFIMQWWAGNHHTEIQSEDSYKEILMSNWFYRVKKAFPENEYFCDGIKWKEKAEDDFVFINCPHNYIKEGDL